MHSNERRIFITGGSGFIGRRVIDLLRARGFQVVNFDLAKPHEALPEVQWVQGDIRRASDIGQALHASSPETVLHLAAHADINSGWEALSSIHAGTQHLLDAIDATPSVRSLVNISTQLVIAPGYRPRSLLDYRPYTLYGEAKAFAEALVLQWRSNVHWLTVRPANIWGPDHPTFANEIWKYIGSRHYVHPNGAPVYRTYGYVENTADQIVRLFADVPQETTYRQTYYAGDAVIDSAQWVDAFAEALTGKPSRRIAPAALKGLGRAGDVVKLLRGRSPIDSGRAMRMTESYPVPLDPTLRLVGPPPVDLAEGVRRTTAWLNSAERK